MHAYSTDSRERLRVALVLGGASVALAWGFYKALTALTLTVPWWFDAPSVVGFYGLLTAAFERALWRVSLLRKVGLVKVPDLRGVWEGQIASSFDAHATSYAATVEIFQTWTHMLVRLRPAH